QIPLDGAVTLRRRNGRVLSLNSFVVLRHLLGPRVIGLEHVENSGRCQSADGVLACPVQERSAIDVPMDIQMKLVQQLLWKIGGLFSFHRSLSFSAKAGRLPLGRRASPMYLRNGSRNTSPSIARCRYRA